MKKATFRRVIENRTTTIQIITIELSMLDDADSAPPALIIDAEDRAVPPGILPPRVLPAGVMQPEALRAAENPAGELPPPPENQDADHSEPEKLE